MRYMTRERKLFIPSIYTGPAHSVNKRNEPKSRVVLYNIVRKHSRLGSNEFRSLYNWRIRNANCPERTRRSKPSDCKSHRECLSSNSSIEKNGDDAAKLITALERQQSENDIDDRKGCGGRLLPTMKPTKLPTSMAFFSRPNAEAR